MQKLRAKQKAEVKSAIIRAGEELIRTKGFSETTIEEITSKAGVARGTFYNYFQTKEDLALELVYETEELSSNQVEEFFSTTVGTDNQVRAILAHTVEWTLKRPELVWISMLEKTKRGATREHPNGTLFRRMMTEAFERGQVDGIVTRERRPQDLANDIDGLYMVHMVRWYHSGRQHDLLSVLQSAVNTYLFGALTHANEISSKII